MKKIRYIKPWPFYEGPRLCFKEVGAEEEVSPERAKTLIAKGFAEAAKAESKPKPKAKPATKKRSVKNGDYDSPSPPERLDGDSD